MSKGGGPVLGEGIMKISRGYTYGSYFTLYIGRGSGCLTGKARGRPMKGPRDVAL